MPDAYTPPTTPHLGLPLPSPDAPSQLEDVARVAAALRGLDDNYAALVEVLAGKAAAGHGHGLADIIGLVEALSGRAAVAHVHAPLDVVGLVEALSGKAAVGHGHTVADIGGLQAALDCKAAVNLANVANSDFSAKAADAGVGGGFKVTGIVTISGNTSITQASHAGKALWVTAGAALIFPAAGSWIGSCVVYNGAGAAITLTSSSGINGASSWVVMGGQSAIVVGDGAQYVATSGGPALTWLVNWTPPWNSVLASLSADAMTALASSNNWSSARTSPLPATNIYFEFHVLGIGAAGNDGMFGVGPPTWDGGVEVPYGRMMSGQLMSNGYGGMTWPAASVGAVVGVAISADGRMWMSHNNNWVGSPSAGTSPSWTGLPANRAAVARLRWAGDAIRLVFAVTAMAYSPPAGFAGIQS